MAGLQGKRVAWRPGFAGGFGGVTRGEAGDYCKVPPGIDPREDDAWYIIDPANRVGAILPSLHRIEEHEDGTITVSPSLDCPGGWHGWLKAGVWSDA